jgi:hypothetical protein
MLFRANAGMKVQETPGSYTALVTDNEKDG